MNSHVQTKFEKIEYQEVSRQLSQANPKHLQGNQIYKIGLSNTSGLQNQTRLAYIYNFKNPTKHKLL